MNPRANQILSEIVKSKLKNCLVGKNFWAIAFFSFCMISFQIKAEGESAKSEIGFWMGASSPFPGTKTASLLDTTMGFGFFTRFQWPYVFYTEMGVSYSNYLSHSERGLTTIPVYAALAYKLPLDLPVSFFIKAGGGASYLIARPSNREGWDPMGYLGFEVSFVAGRKVRIGLRYDYNHIMERKQQGFYKGSNIPYLYNYPYYSQNQDSRLYNPNYYNLIDGQFFHFGLMVSILL